MYKYKTKFEDNWPAYNSHHHVSTGGDYSVDNNFIGYCRLRVPFHKSVNMHNNKHDSQYLRISRAFLQSDVPNVQDNF